MPPRAKSKADTAPAPWNRSAEEIYKLQNKWLHKAFAAAGYPYKEHKAMWMETVAAVVGREPTGLSDMTLGERDLVLHAFQQKGMDVLNPAVPKRLRGWKSGDPGDGYTMRREREPQLRLILALWAELGQEPQTIRTVVQKRYKVDDLRFLTPEQRTKFANYLLARLKAAKRPAKIFE